jgi:hypothetical protein
MNFPDDDQTRGSHTIATDIIARLEPDMEINKVLLWPPNMFAFTSYILDLTSSYQLVVSPPRNKII